MFLENGQKQRTTGRLDKNTILLSDFFPTKPNMRSSWNTCFVKKV